VISLNSGVRYTGTLSCLDGLSPPLIRKSARLSDVAAGS
jgi:hypothetical protein